jgi:hypothetical protein
VSIIPTHWYVYCLGSTVEYSFSNPEKGIHSEGSALGHVEKNWGQTFPAGHVRVQAFSADNSAQVMILRHLRVNSTQHFYFKVLRQRILLFQGIFSDRIFVYFYVLRQCNLLYQSTQMMKSFIRTYSDSVFIYFKVLKKRILSFPLQSLIVRLDVIADLPGL